MSEPPISGQGLKKGNPNPLYVINSKPTGMSACIHKELDDWPEFFGVVMRLTFSRSWLWLEIEGRTELELGLGALFACRCHMP